MSTPRLHLQLCDTVESTLRQLSFYRGILNECDDCIAEDGIGERADVLKSIAIGCRAKGLVRLDQLNILADVPPTHYDPEQYKFGKYSEQSPADAVNDLCGRTLSDFEHQEALLDRIIQVQCCNIENAWNSCYLCFTTKRSGQWSKTDAKFLASMGRCAKRRRPITMC